MRKYTRSQVIEQHCRRRSENKQVKARTNPKARLTSRHLAPPFVRSGLPLGFHDETLRPAPLNAVVYSHIKISSCLWTLWTLQALEIRRVVGNPGKQEERERAGTFGAPVLHGDALNYTHMKNVEFQ